MVAKPLVIDDVEIFLTIAFTTGPCILCYIV